MRSNLRGATRGGQNGSESAFVERALARDSGASYHPRVTTDRRDFIKRAALAAASASSIGATDAIAQAVATLPERCRMVFELSRRHNMSYAQIADALDLLFVDE